MSVKVLLLEVLFVFLSVFNANAQLTVCSEKSCRLPMFKLDTTARIISLIGKNVSGNISLDWVVSGLKENGIFIVYCSPDGINFSVIGSQKAVDAPVNFRIRYSFTDKDFNEAINYYKVVYVRKHSEYLTSETIEVNKENNMIAKAHEGNR